jgi:hypothetical protein
MVAAATLQIRSQVRLGRSPLHRSTTLGFRWVDPLVDIDRTPALVGIQALISLRWVRRRHLPWQRQPRLHPL